MNIRTRTHELLTLVTIGGGCHALVDYELFVYLDFEPMSISSNTRWNGLVAGGGSSEMWLVLRSWCLRKRNIDLVCWRKLYTSSP